MRTAETVAFLLLSPWIAAGCGTATEPCDCHAGTCGDASGCVSARPPESVCLAQIEAGHAEDGCGVFVSWLFGNDKNPGTKAKPVHTLARAIALARVGSGRVFACSEAFIEPITLPSGVDLIGTFDCLNGWIPSPIRARAIMQLRVNAIPVLTVEPPEATDTGAADGVSKIVDIRFYSQFSTAVLIRSNTAVEFVNTEIGAGNANAGADGDDADGRAPDGLPGKRGGDACIATDVPGGAVPMNRCEVGDPTSGGKGGDGYPDHGGDGEDGTPLPVPNPGRYGVGGAGEHAGMGCMPGIVGISGEYGAGGTFGDGLGRITEAGWEGAKAGDGAPGRPGGGGGGGGGVSGALARCGAGLNGGAGGGSGGTGGCGGKGGKGGENGKPSIGILALHAKVTVRGGVIETGHAGHGGNGGRPQEGGYGGRGFLGGMLNDGTFACQGGNGGDGGYGGYGGGGRGGSVFGIAYLDEDQLVLENVTFQLGMPGLGGFRNIDDPSTRGPSGIAAEKMRFPE